MAVDSVSLQERLDRWAERLQNLTVSPLTRDYPDSHKSEHGPSKRAIEAYESLTLPRDVQLALQSISAPSIAPDFTLLLAAFVVLVARLTGDEDIALGTSTAHDGRPFVLRVSIDASETFMQLHDKVKKVCRRLL